MSDKNCENCNAVLTGPYCSACGQHAHASARTLQALLHDVFHDLTHFEGRVWTSLKLLVTRPGRLTQEYFSGRRNRFAPPFRLYLVVSVLFFALSSWVERVDPEQPPVTVHAAHTQAEPAATNECADIHMNSASQERFVRQLCQRVTADGGRTVSHTFASYIPKTMFVFLPLVAAILALIYRRSGRYYVEHLVLVLHNHAAVFALMAFARLLHLIGVVVNHWSAAHSVLDFIRNGLDIGLMVYVPWYTYCSLRNFYGLSRSSTAVRLIPLGFAYLFCLALTFGATFLLSAAFV